jgi:dolichol-phosphate mannosyltransferase
MRVVVIVPTYNERENIGPLIDAISAQFQWLASRQPSHEMRMLVVDDHSPDATAEVVQERQGRHAWLHLLQGEKAGLGAAYLRGMRHALNEMAADVVFEMDADFSHRPEDIPRLLAQIEAGADFAIGSRYVTGGSIPSAWGWRRRLISRVGNWVARRVAGLAEVRDCTAGFRAIRAEVLRGIGLNRIKTQGYAFQVALLHAALRRGAKVVEIPVDFVDRDHGSSKLGLTDILEFIGYAGWLRLRDTETFIKFAVVGLSGVMVNLGSFTMLLALHLSHYLASPLAVELAIVSNFLFNDGWTFRRRKPRDGAWKRAMKFNGVSLVALVVSYATFLLLEKVAPHHLLQLYQLAGIIPATFINYALNSGWTFADKRYERPCVPVPAPAL